MAFYIGFLVISVFMATYVLNLGPFQPKITVYLREPSSALSATDPAFAIYVHPAAEDMYVSVQVQRTGLWEKDLEERIQQVMKPFQNVTFLDVGAHIGYYTLAAATVGHKV
jgi:hypothetical protein